MGLGVRVSDVKLRSFIFPGQHVETEATVARTDGATLVTFIAMVDGKRVASTRVQIGGAESS